MSEFVHCGISGKNANIRSVYRLLLCVKHLAAQGSLIEWVLS